LFVLTAMVAQGSTSPEAPTFQSSQRQPTKIGIVNIQDAIVATSEGKKEFDALQARFGPKQKELKDQNDELERLRKEYQSQKDTLSAGAAASLVNTISAKTKQLQHDYEEAQAQFQAAEQEVLNRIGRKMLTVLEKYAKDNGYSMVLDVSNPKTPVLWSNAEGVVTRNMVEAYDGRTVQPAANAGVTRVGIVNIQDAIVATDEAKKELNALRARFAPKQKELKDLSDEIERLKKQYQSQKDTLSAGAAASLANTIEAKNKQLTRDFDDAQAEFQQANQEVVNRIGSKMLTVLEKYAKDNGYSMILDIPDPRTFVLWGDPGTSLTKDLVDTYNGRGLPPSAHATAATKVGIVRMQEVLAKSNENKQGVDEGKKLTLLEEYAKANEYTLILDVSDPQTPVLWAAAGTDITPALQNVYNAGAFGRPPAPTTNLPAVPPRGVLAVPENNQQTLRDVTGPFFALIVGINQYPAIPGKNLTTAVNDARELEAVLRTQYGFKTNLLIDAKATRSGILFALSEYRAALTQNASLLIYFAGHGYRDQDNEKTYWLPSNAELNNPSNWIIADDITSAIRAIPARHILVVSDSCYSGGLTRDLVPRFTSQQRDVFLEKMASRSSRSLLASGGLEPVADLGGRNTHSVFAAAFLQGLQEMESDVFTADELFTNYIRLPVAGHSEQVPEYSMIRNSGSSDGDFIFVRQSAAATRPH
jgi:Skp family chaperone for outer membrane proteins